MKSAQPPMRPKPARVTGPAHVFAAARYSLAGLRRLWQETALRHILLALVAGMIMLVACGAKALDFAGFAVLSLALIAIESLNTAIECIVDHLAEDWQAFARDAKDLGSLATLCMLLAWAGFLAAILFRSFFTLG